jgi:hypothetical protein
LPELNTAQVKFRLAAKAMTKSGIGEGVIVAGVFEDVASGLGDSEGVEVKADFTVSVSVKSEWAGIGVFP